MRLDLLSVFVFLQGAIEQAVTNNPLEGIGKGEFAELVEMAFVVKISSQQLKHIIGGEILGSIFYRSTIIT